MMDMGFLPDIRRIMAKTHANRQTLLFSATMPKQIRSLANDFLTNPSEIAVTPGAQPIDLIDQKVILVDKASKRRILVDLLKSGKVTRAIVFTRTKRGADKVASHLDKAGITAAAIHGNKSQNHRDRTLAAFKSGHVNILVATDIAARGIDVDDVSHVFNFELPHVPECYVHRIGRTARAGKKGFAVSLCDSEERGLMRDIEKLIGYKILTKEANFTKDEQPLLEQVDVEPVPVAHAPRQAPAKKGRSRRGPAPTHHPRPNAGKPAQRRRDGRKPGGKSAGGAQPLMRGTSAR